MWGVASVGSVLIAEDFLLLLSDDTSGRLSARGDVLGIMLAGANLVELALMGRVDLARVVKPVRFEGMPWDDKVNDRLFVRDPSPTDDAVLDAALQDVIASQGKLSVIRLPRQRAKNLQETLYERLVSGGMVATSSARSSSPTDGRLRIPATRWRCADG